MKKKHHNEDMQQLYGRGDEVSMNPMCKGMILQAAPLKQHLETGTRILDSQVYRSKKPDVLRHGNALCGPSFCEGVDVGRYQHSRVRSITYGYVPKFDGSSGYCFYSEREPDQSTSSSEAGKCKYTYPPDKCSSTVDKISLADTQKNFPVKNLNELAASISIFDQHRVMHQKYLNSGNKFEPEVNDREISENRRLASQSCRDFSVMRSLVDVHVHSNTLTSKDRSLGNKISSEILMGTGNVNDEDNSTEQETYHSRGYNTDISARTKHAAHGGVSKNSLLNGSRFIQSGKSNDTVGASFQNEDTSSVASGGAVWDIFRR